MGRLNINDLVAFLTVARAQSFTRAAAQLGVSPSALSHSMRGLEERLGVRLLMRTTRKVTSTEAGERLTKAIGPHLDAIETEVSSLSELRDKPGGTVRINTSEHAAKTILWPAIARLLPAYPDINVELGIDQSLTDIVAGRYDAGVRLGEQVAKDMIAVRIGPDLRMAVVGAPSYLAEHPAPESPHDLADHDCINLRLPTLGGVYAWELEKDGRPLNVRVEGRLVFNDVSMVVEAAASGFGLACVLEDYAEASLASGLLTRVLEDWCPPFSGYHLYYPSRRQLSPAFALVLDLLRYRETTQ